MSTESIINGYYGKVSTHGDFVTRGLPASFINPWDAWLKEVTFNSQLQLGDKWLKCYLTGPIYRFVLTPGICGENGWMGLIMPSVDSIGRHYPMTIVTMNRLKINPFIALQDETQWFNQAEALALSTLEDNFNLQQFNCELDLLNARVPGNHCDPSIPAEQITRRVAVNNAWQQTMQEGQTITQLLPCFLDNLLKEHCFAYSVWWTQGSEQVASSFLICEGLPPFDGVAAMLDGDWQKWGWGGNRFPDLPFGAQNVSL